MFVNYFYNSLLEQQYLVSARATMPAVFDWAILGRPTVNLENLLRTIPSCNSSNTKIKYE